MKTVFFDLDGTLTDSRPGILAGVAYAMGRLGVAVKAEEVSTAFIGPPLYDSFRALYGLDDPTAKRAVGLYREYYSEEGILQNEVYAGVPALLEGLSSAGIRLALATGKPHPYARRILAHFGLDRFFSAVFGAEFDGTHGEKADLLAYATTTLGVPPCRALMVGDRRYDIEGALAVGATPVGVLWGYGSYEELSLAGAVHLAATPEEAEAVIRALAQEK